jgi:hypothetical protein
MSSAYFRFLKKSFSTACYRLMGPAVVLPIPPEIAIVYRVSQDFMDNALRDFPAVLAISKSFGLDFFFYF